MFDVKFVSIKEEQLPYHVKYAEARRFEKQL